MNYKTATTQWVPPVTQNLTKAWTNSDVQDLFNKFQALPDPDSEWSLADEALNEEVMDGLESLLESVGNRKAKSLLKDAGASKEQLAQMF